MRHIVWHVQRDDRLTLYAFAPNVSNTLRQVRQVFFYLRFKILPLSCLLPASYLPLTCLLPASSPWLHASRTVAFFDFRGCLLQNRQASSPFQKFLPVEVADEVEKLLHLVLRPAVGPKHRWRGNKSVLAQKVRLA